MNIRTLKFLICAVTLVAPALQAQDKPVREKDVPAAVLAAFHRAYPAAKIRGTSTEVEKGKRYYEIESLEGGQARDILYIADGTAVEIEEAVPAASLDELVRDAVAREFPNAEVVKAERVTKGTAVSFEIHVRLGSKKGSVVMNPAGTVLEKHPLAVPKKKPAAGKKEETEEEDD